jgi:hypothetical protein
MTRPAENLLKKWALSLAENALRLKAELQLNLR